MRQCTSVTDRQTDRQTDTDILHLAPKMAAAELKPGLAQYKNSSECRVIVLKLRERSTALSVPYTNTDTHTQIHGILMVESRLAACESRD